MCRFLNQFKEKTKNFQSCVKCLHLMSISCPWAKKGIFFYVHDLIYVDQNIIICFCKRKKKEGSSLLTWMIGHSGAKILFFFRSKDLCCVFHLKVSRFEVIYLVYFHIAGISFLPQILLLSKGSSVCREKRLFMVHTETIGAGTCHDLLGLLI